ncbi:hypothetical protein H7698_13870 [Pseudomonas sp. p50]|uniref:hypothetical protein n=1 Tax=Pseudomonas sp. p50(2008) TaxID=2816832 RepID=UPI001889E927|nr:hypothetical protein [Pseudomonas sp. p50(2008)]MBF4557167.1 hypothetical protein [Pseudomonas sp. p50(2008)]
MTIANASLLATTPLVLTETQRALLAELIIDEQRHASRWWTHLNEMRWRNELPEWANAAGAGGHPEYGLWCESRKALNQALFGSDDPGADRDVREIAL